MEVITREEQFMAAAAGQAVELPEPITRREKFLKAIAERGGGAQPDMAQNDPTQPDYVKNRTHYETEEDVFILPEELYTFEYSSNPVYTWMHACFAESSNGLVAGETYSVVWDGVRYDNLVCVAHEEEGFTYIGGVMEADGLRGYDFAVFCDGNGSFELYTASTETSHSVCVMERKTVVHKLDEKYLPDSVENHTYWFAGYRDGEEYVLYEGSYAEFMEGFGKRWFTAKVLDESGGIPVIFPFSEIYDSSAVGEVLSFQRTYFNRDKLKLVCDAIEIVDGRAQYVTFKTTAAPG